MWYNDCMDDQKGETLYHPLNEPLHEALAQHRSEYRNDVAFDRTDVGEMAMKVPGIKAKWVARHDEYRNLKIDAERMLAAELKAAVKRVREASPIELTKAAAEKKAAEDDPRIAIIQERIELLDRLAAQSWEIVDKHLRYLNNEIQTVVDTIKLETM